MGIEEAKEILKAYDFGFTGYAGSLKEAISTVLPVVEKYQCIQAIINNAKDSDGAVKYNWLYEQIREVVEDGNDSTNAENN